MLIAFDGHRDMGQFLGDTLCSIKVAWLFAAHHPVSKIMLTLSPSSDTNYLWQKFISTYNVDVIEDTFDPGNNAQRYEHWDKWRRERHIDNKPFDIYKELYRRIDGAQRQGVICGGEKGLGRKNIFEYLYFGQEQVAEPVIGSCTVDDSMIYWQPSIPERDVLIAPYAKCQGNSVFTFDFWDKVARSLVASGVLVTVNHNGNFCDDLLGNPCYTKIFPSPKSLPDQVCKHKMVACGNTGIGWVAAMTGTPLLAMQPPDSNMQDYRYEWCGVQSLIEIVDRPDADYVAQKIIEKVNEELVLTTGCYDTMHVGHVRHLQESAALGTKLVVCLNSDTSVKRLKGEDRPIHNQDERAEMLRSIKGVDEVVVFDEPDATRLIRKYRPKIITNGADHKREEIVGKEFVEAFGGHVEVTGDGAARGPTTTRVVAKLTRIVDVASVIREAQALTPNPPEKMKLLAEQLLSVLSLPGDIADLGTYRGGSALVMRKLAPDKLLHLFCTWAGNPHDDPLCHHKVGEWAASIDEVKRLIPIDRKTRYHQGVFPASATDAKDHKFCLAYVDFDTYVSTKAALEWLWDRMVTGGKVVVDDWDWPACAGVKKAVQEFFKPEQLQVYGSEKTCVISK